MLLSYRDSFFHWNPTDSSHYCYSKFSTVKTPLFIFLRALSSEWGGLVLNSFLPKFLLLVWFSLATVNRLPALKSADLPSTPSACPMLLPSECAGIGWTLFFLLQNTTSRWPLSTGHFLSMCSLASELKMVNMAHMATMSKPHGIFGNSKSSGISM